MEAPVPHSERIEEYWSWVAVALFLLLAVDLLTTIIAAGVVGTRAEANLVVRWGLEQGPAYLIAINLGALVLLAVLFYGLIHLSREAPEPFADMIALSFEVWIGLLVAVGLLVFANNLLVILFHRDLLSLLTGLLG